MVKLMETNKNKAFTKDQIDKIGNSIIYLSQTLSDLNKTKILKLLFLLEEASIKKYGTPFFNIDFQLWKHGPVAKDIYIDLCEESPNLLDEYIKRDTQNASNFVAKRSFSDDQFSDNDIEIMDKVVAFAKQKNATYLVNHTHDHNSLWRKSAIKHGILELLEKELVNSTDLEIDFNLLFDNAELSYLRERYEEAKDNRAFIRQLKK
ncbi:MAG: SocA family protein [Niastella sp.]|nr:SocA family protein [Niastella sp.]